jgi:hypothetical protein
MGRNRKTPMTNLIIVISNVTPSVPSLLRMTALYNVRKMIF